MGIKLCYSISDWSKDLKSGLVSTAFIPDGTVHIRVKIDLKSQLNVSNLSSYLEIVEIFSILKTLF